jgi:hypothetical protein
MMDVRSRANRSIRHAATAKARHYACFAGGHEKLAGRIAGIALRQGADHGHKTGGTSLFAIAVHLKG